jgi:N-acetylmuramoyl-L-alanine amidase
MFFFPRRIAPFSLLVLLFAAASVPAQTSGQHPPRVEGIRFWSFGDVTRVAIETSGEYKLYTEQIETPSRVFFDLTGLQPPSSARHNMQAIQVNDHRLRQIRVARLSGDKTRIVFDLDGPAEVVSSQLVNPDRLMVEIRPRGTSLPALTASRTVAGSHRQGFGDGVPTKGGLDLSAHGRAIDNDIAVREPITAKIAASNPAMPKADPDDAYHPPHSEQARQVATIPSTVSASSPAAIAHDPTPDMKPAQMNPTDRSLVRVFGLKLGRVVIDAGHGGHDSGTIGPNGLMEKDLVLDVALRLGALISKRMGAEVIYTRSTDVFIPLEERTRIANAQRADLFISIHANSSPEPSATGVETYYFNLNSDKSALDLATRENATADSSISDLNDLLHRAVLQTKREESREFAQRIQESLAGATPKSSSQVRDRGVRQAPFLVLIGATMPSILAEIGFVSNPRDERLLRRSDQRQKIAEALFKGVLQYSNSLNHVQIARAGGE